MSHGKGITIAEECHIVNALPPVDIGAAAKTSDYFSMANYAHASIIVTMGAVGNDTTITLFEATTIGPAAETVIGFDLYQEVTAAGDTLGARTATAVGGFATGTNTGTIHVIEIDASELTDGYPYLAVKTTNAAAALISVVAILSGTRYQSAVTPTAIT